MAVARKAEVERQPRQVVALGEQVESAGKPKLAMIAVKWNSLMLREDLGEIHHRYADFRRYLSESPTASHVLHQDQLGPLDDLPSTVGRVLTGN